jgi:hypothetical protein
VKVKKTFFLHLIGINYKVIKMTPYKELFGLADTTFTDQEIIEIIEKARQQQKYTVEFISGKRRINVIIPPVRDDGAMSEGGSHT